MKIECGPYIAYVVKYDGDYADFRDSIRETNRLRALLGHSPEDHAFSYVVDGYVIACYKIPPTVTDLLNKKTKEDEFKVAANNIFKLAKDLEESGFSHQEALSMTMLIVEETLSNLTGKK